MTYFRVYLLCEKAPKNLGTGKCCKYFFVLSYVGSSASLGGSANHLETAFCCNLSFLTLSVMLYVASFILWYNYVEFYR